MAGVKAVIFKCIKVALQLSQPSLNSNLYLLRLSDTSLKMNYDVFYEFAYNSSSTLLAVLYRLNHFGDYDELLHIAGEIVEMRKNKLMEINNEEEDVAGHIEFLLNHYRRSLTERAGYNESDDEVDIMTPLVVQIGRDQNRKASFVEEELILEDRVNFLSEQKITKRITKINNDINRKKNYQGRASKRQIEVLITYLEQHPNLTSDKFSTLNGHKKLQNDWEKLARYLNALVLNGKEKDVKSWKNTWRDQKCKVLKKVQKIATAITNHNPIEMNLTELDKKILKIIGCYKYVKDLTNVPYRFPEEQIISKKNAIKKLRAGNAWESSEIIEGNDKYAKAVKMLAKIKKMLKMFHE